MRFPLDVGLGGGQFFPSLTSGAGEELIGYADVLSRCENPNHHAYPRYGGAGILVCPRWHKFTEFLKDVGKRPIGKTLGRLMDLGNYEPGNVFWMTKKEQTQAQIDRRKWKSLNALIVDITI
jgi:hypothetical protein